jgi:hypothetical protein
LQCNWIAETISKEGGCTPCVSGTSIGDETVPTSASEHMFAVVQYVEPVSKGGHSLRLPRNLINPYPNEAPIAQLQRLRQLREVSLGGPAAGSYTGTDFAVWPLIQADPVFAQLALQFKGIRCDITLKFFQRAAPVSYGAFSVSYRYSRTWEAAIAAGTSGRWLGVHQRWSSPTHQVDIGTSETLELTFPYRHNMNYLHCKAGSDTDYLWISVINQMMITAGANDTLNLDIYYSLSNIDCGMYTASNVIDAQSSIPVLHPPEPNITPVIGPHDTQFHEYMTRYHSKEFTNPAWDAMTDYKHGPATNVVEDHGPQPVVKTTGRTSFGGGTMNMKNNPAGELSSARCSETLNFLELFENDGRVDLPGMKSEHSLRELAMIPGMIKSFRLSSSTAKDFSIKIPVCLRDVGLDVTTNEVTWAAYYSEFFRFYRGNHKYMFHWNTSPMIATRIKVSIQYLSEPTPSSLTVSPTAFPLSDEMPAQHYLIKGSCCKEIVVPWHSFLTMERPIDILAILNIVVIQPPNKFGADDGFVSCVVSHSVDDCHYYSLCSPMNPDTAVALVADEEEIVDPQSGDIRAMHYSAKGEFAFTATTHDVSTHMVEVKDLFTLFRRWDDQFLHSGTAGIPAAARDCTLRSPDTTTAWNRASIIETASFPFLFNTGAIEQKFIFDPAATGIQVVYIKSVDLTTSVKTGHGCAAYDLSQTKIVEFLIPYLSTSPVYYRRPGTMTSPSTVQINFTPNLNIIRSFQRGGCDFTVYYPNSLPDPDIWLAYGVAH